jgi:hypothetical protein
MLQIVYFSEKSEFLTEVEGRAGEKIYVTPSPAKADALRSALRSSLNSDVITISKFTGLLGEHLWEAASRPQLKRKAELLLIFSILKNQHLPELGFEQFREAYGVFSDLRSFTLNLEALAPVLEEHGEEIRSTVKLFWYLLELTGYQDEHGAYQAIAEELRSHEEVEFFKRRTIIFWGFQHLNGQQIDLLKALAIRYTVIIPFPLALRDKIRRSDWISWIRESQVNEVELHQELSAPRATWVPINSREIALTLRQKLNADQPVQVMLGTSKLKPHHIDLIPHQRLTFKVPTSLLEVEIQQVFDLCEDLRTEHPTASALRMALRELRKKAQTFPLMRAFQLYEEALLKVDDLTELDVLVDDFFLKTLREVALLNQPRSSLAPVFAERGVVHLKDFSSFDHVEPTVPLWVCVDETFEDVISLGQNYPEQIQKYLSPIGPLKRNELELQFRRWEFESVIRATRATFFLPEGLLKHSLVWKKLLGGITLERVDGEIKRGAVQPTFTSIDVKAYEGHFTASRLQSYLDCPRRFYHSFVNRVLPDLGIKKDVSAPLAGTIVHKIIEDYFDRGEMGPLSPELSQGVFDAFIAKEGLTLPREVYRQKLLLLHHRAQNGLGFLAELSAISGEAVDWKIEAPFEASDSFPLKGQMDALGTGARTLFLLDFKSTKSSASSNLEIEQFESLQLWVYAHAARARTPDWDRRQVVIGYVVLDDPSESNLLLADEDLFIKLKAQKLCRTKVWTEDFNDYLHRSGERIQELMSTIRDDRSFHIRPRKPQVCHFCEVAPVCPKGAGP